MRETQAHQSNASSHAPRRAAFVWGLLVILLSVFVVWFGLWSGRREADFQVDSIRRSIEVHSLGLRGAAAQYSYLPFTAAQHAEVLAALVHSDPVRRQRANRYLEDVNRQAGSDTLYVIDLDGITVAASNWSDPKSFVGKSYVYRPYFIDAKAGRSGLFYGVGKDTLIPGLFISAPVRHDGVVVGVVAVKVSLAKIQDAWTHSRDPVMLADHRGIFFLGSVAPWLYQAIREPLGEDLAWIRRHQQYWPRTDFSVVPWGIERTAGQTGYRIRTELDGSPREFLAVDELLPELGWTLTVTADYAAVVRARNRAWALGGLGASLLILGGLYWQLRERRFSEQRSARSELELKVEARTQELGEAQSFRKAMEDSLLIGLRARDLAGHIIYVNPALCEMTGYLAEELLGRLPPYPYWHPGDVEKHWLDNADVLSGKASLTGFESRVRHRDGHDVLTMVYTAPLINADGKHSGWMSSVVDISEQRRGELRQRRQDEQLQHAQRLASLGEMASTVAHELNQPLMALSNFASAAKAFALQDNHHYLIDSLDELMAQAQRAGEIVRRVRGFVRQRTQGAEACEINDIVVNVMALLGAEARTRQVHLTRKLAPHLPVVIGDRVLLEQVLFNLVVNAMQAMQGTAVDLREVEISTTWTGGMVTVSVADRGPGIAPEVAAQLFDPFFTTKADGLGLGLNICHTIVESHSGHLVFESRADGGTIFTFTVPEHPSA